MKTDTVTIVGLVALAGSASAHTWVEMLKRISPTGEMIGNPGYPRGYVPRSAPNFNDKEVLYQLPPPGTAAEISKTVPITKFSANDYSVEYPMLEASPGDYIALRYQENGHVSLPQNTPNKPANRGTVYVYATLKSSSDDTFLGIHKVWNADGTGGDKRGFLLATRHFDDGRCHQTNPGTIAKDRAAEFPKTPDALQGTDLWCQTDIQLPFDLELGSMLTLHWLWDWPTLNPALIDVNTTGNGLYPTQGGVVKIPEVYLSTCDIKIVANASLTAREEVVSAASNTSPDKIGSAAIPAQLQNLFQVLSPNSGSGGSSAGSDASSSASASTSASPTTPMQPETTTNAAVTATPATTEAPVKKVVTVTADAVTVTSTVTAARHTETTSVVLPTSRAGSTHKRRVSGRI